MLKKDNRGGARPGAGRKAKEPTTTTGFRINSEALEIIREAKYPINKAVNDLAKEIAKKIKKDAK